MKITVTLKDPDGFSDDVLRAVVESLNEINDIDDREKEILLERRLEKTWDKLEKFVDCKEYVTIEFDTDTGTAIVVPSR